MTISIKFCDKNLVSWKRSWAQQIRDLRKALGKHSCATSGRSVLMRKEEQEEADFAYVSGARILERVLPAKKAKKVGSLSSTHS